MMDVFSNTNTQLSSVAVPAVAAASTAVSTDDGTFSPKRKNAKVNNGAPKFVPFHVAQPPRVSYAGAASNAVPNNPPSVHSAASSPQEQPSICAKFLVAGETMLRPSRDSAVPAVDPSKVPPLLGVLIKTVLTYDKKWKHYVMFNSTEYEVIAAKDVPYPEALLPSAHPGRIVSIRSDLVVPRSPILASNLHVPGLADIQRMNNMKFLTQLLPDGFGKIHYEPTGMHVKVLSSTYKSGPDDKVSFLRPIFNHKTESYLLIPVSKLTLSDAKEVPELEQSLLPQGTQVKFKFSPGLTTGKTYACNLSLVTILPADNTFGSPPKKVDTIIQPQPGGVPVDLHVAPYGITLRSNRCALLCQHMMELIPKDALPLYIIHSNARVNDSNTVSVGELDRAFRNAHKSNWDQANLDRIVEMILLIKNNNSLNEHKAQKKKFTVIFSLANQNQQNVISKNIADSYNIHNPTGHTLLHPECGVLMELEPTAITNKGIAKVNAAQILSKAHCTSLRSTHSYTPGYAIPFVKDRGLVELDAAEHELGRSLTHVSILAFADAAKSYCLKEFQFQVNQDVVIPLPLENNVIPIQWKHTKKGEPKNPIVNLITNKEFLKLAKVEEPKAAGRKRKFDKVIKTCFITPQPAYAKTVLTLLLKSKDVLVMPNSALDENGFMVRTNRPYPKEAFDILEHPGIQYGQFLSPFAVRFIFAVGFGREVIPVLLKLEKTVAYSDDNFSLSPDAGSPWSEVITEGAHATLGRTLLPPTEVCPHSSYIGGFTGFPTTHWLEEVLFRTILDRQLMVVDTPEETTAGGVFIQYLKSTIRPRTLQGKDTTISIYTCNEVVRQQVVDMVKLVAHFSSDSLYPVTDGLQFLTVQSAAVSLIKGTALEEEALANIQTFTNPPTNDPDDGFPHELNGAENPPQGAQTDPLGNSDGQWDEVVNNRRVTRSNKTGNTNNQQHKPSHNATQNNQQSQSRKGNQYLSLPTNDDDVALWNDPSVVAVAEGRNSRKPDAGDFDTNKDTRITQYFMKKLNGSRPEPQIKNIIKPVVTIWARDYPSYHTKQLGNNFTGRDSIGGLIVAIGSNPKISMGKVMSLLIRCVKEGRPKETLCEELALYLEEQTEKLQPSDTTTQSQQQQQQSKKRATNSTSTTLTTTPANSHTDNNTTNKNTTDSSTITRYFNPLNSIPINLINSQEDKGDSNEVKVEYFDHEMDDMHHDTDQGTVVKSTAEEKKSEPPPSGSPFKAFANLASRALDFFNDVPDDASSHGTAEGDGIIN